MKLTTRLLLVCNLGSTSLLVIVTHSPRVSRILNSVRPRLIRRVVLLLDVAMLIGRRVVGLILLTL